VTGKPLSSAGIPKPRSRGFPRSGVGPCLSTGSACISYVKPRSRGFSGFGLSLGRPMAKAKRREAP